nr:hypothetical protein GCM10017745_51170 [Saccharothrix mutabilis subsp. capreolus]
MDVADLPLSETCCPEGRATIRVQVGRAAYLGPSLHLDPHAGSVFCFGVGIDEPFTPRADPVGERRVRSALIPLARGTTSLPEAGSCSATWTRTPPR